MVSYFCCYTSASSIFSSTTQIRSFCLSSLLLAILFTFINFLTTTTSVKKLSTIEYRIEQNLSSTTPSLPLLSLTLDDVHHHRFDCYGRFNRQRLHRKMLSENQTVLSIVELQQPNKTSGEINLISYNYDTWRSSPLMPRLVSKCEHNIMIQLLKRFDQLTKKYSLDYMMIDGTLLGSWRHHDLIPWDDDIDLLMSVRLKENLDKAVALESPASPYFIEFHRRWDAPKAFEYYKFYFSTSPRFSEHPWRYPFVDLIFYHENETHLWQENMQHISAVTKNHIFPLKLRPLGPLWLPAPRSPHDYFLSVNWTTYDQQCFNGLWSHKYERTKDFDYGSESKLTVNCEELRDFYPFVERSSTDTDERLIINGTVTQIVKMMSNNRQ